MVVGRRLGRDPVRPAHGVAHEMAPGSRLIVSTDCDRVIGAGLAAVDARRVPEDRGERGRRTARTRRSGSSCTSRTRRPAGGGRGTVSHRLRREQVALQSEPALPGDERQRVGQREQDQVVRVRCVRSRNARPSSMCTLTRGSWYGCSGCRSRPEPLQDRVDLHGVHVRRALRQGERDVVAAAGTHDQDVARSARAGGRTGYA